MNFYENIITRATSFEIMIALNFFMSVNNFFDTFYFFKSKSLIEKHRNSWPDNRKRMIYNPNSNCHSKYRISPIPSKEFWRQKCYKYTSVHIEIGGVVKCICFDNERIIDLRNSEEVPHNNRRSDNGEYHGKYF